MSRTLFTSLRQAPRACAEIGAGRRRAGMTERVPDLVDWHASLDHLGSHFAPEVMQVQILNVGLVARRTPQAAEATRGQHLA